ncbi:metallopeptidase family protein [Candidatus Woesebacteria bacterium]|nr:MAG: metallopeptidase family protein [Candidatus Woesebacteria bacterium]
MSDDKFEEILNKALESIPGEFRKNIENVSITYQDFPTKKQLDSVNARGLLLGLYEGVPTTRGSRYMVKLPDKITIFKIPILMFSKTKSVEETVRDTLIHEIAHHFGMNEKQVRDAEKTNGNKYKKKKIY